MSAKKQLVVFDFDWSFVDQDTDRYVFEVLAPELRILLRSRKQSMQWTDNVADCLRRLHEKGIKRSEIESAFNGLPLHPAMKRGVRELPAQIPTTFFLLSNSNYVFISTILAHHGLLLPDSPPSSSSTTTTGSGSVTAATPSSTKDAKNLFEEIVTNPAEWDGDLVALKRRVDPQGPQHGCKVGCSPNMCKGDELEAFIARHGGRQAFQRIIYVGDGGNDFCPILRLSSADMAFVRSHRELQRRIERDGQKAGLKAEVHYWGGAWEVELLFQSLPPL